MSEWGPLWKRQLMTEMFIWTIQPHLQESPYRDCRMIVWHGRRVLEKAANVQTREAVPATQRNRGKGYE
jgi:hypothetical protein